MAVSVMDIDFLNIDINPCPISIGNERPNYFESTARCKESTMVGILIFHIRSSNSLTTMMFSAVLLLINGSNKDKHTG